MTTASRPTRRLRPIHFVLSLLLALGGVIGIAAPASAAAGLIDGHVYELDGTTPIVGATVLFDDGSVPPAYVTTTTDSNGYYSFTPDPAFDDQFFEIVVLGGADHLDADDTGYFDTADTTSGEMPDFLLGPARRITGTVRDAATGLPLDDVIVVATGITSGEVFAALPPTDATGTFDVGVSPGDDYELVAVKGFSDYDPQFWDHLNLSVLSGCGCTQPDLVTVPSGTGSPITGIDFDLLAYDEWIWFSVYAAKDSIGTEYPGVLVYLDKWDAGSSTWDPVTSGVTDADGYVDLFGFGDGDYRLRYKIGGSFVTVLSYDDYINTAPFPVWEGGFAVHLLMMETDSCGCGFAEQYVDLVFAAPSSPGGGGGGTSTPPRKPRTSTFTFTLPTPTATPTPSATPTSTPSPSPTQSGDPTPTPTPTVDPTPSGDTGFPWWIILIIVLILAIVITVIVIVRRR